jgi:hypothetical protein
MLKPAVLYKEEIQKELAKRNYTEDMIFFTGYLGNPFERIGEDNNGDVYQYAIVEKDKLIGYFTYQVDWYSSCASRFGLFSFDRNNTTIGLDIYSELKKLINNYHIHRIEWHMISGNPVEKHYDKFCKKYNGKKFVLTDALKDRAGKYHNSVIYEIILHRKAQECSGDNK